MLCQQEFLEHRTSLDIIFGARPSFICDGEEEHFSAIGLLGLLVGGKGWAKWPSRFALLSIVGDCTPLAPVWY